MAFIHGSTTKILGDEWDLSPYFNQANLNKQAQAVDATNFGSSGNRQYVYGLESGSAAFAGLFDGAVSIAADANLTTALGAEGIYTVCLNGYDTIGKPAVLFKGENVSYQVRSPVQDIVRTQFNATVDGGIRFGGVVLHTLTAETTTGNYTSVDNTALTSVGGVGHLHVTSFTGTNVTVKIQHSTDNSVWADLITFTSVTGVTSERSTVTGTVNRYVRAQISAGTFTSVTFAVAFARNKQ